MTPVGDLLSAKTSAELRHHEPQAVFAHDAGYVIDWESVVGDENDRACVAAMEHDNRSLLLAMFDRIVA